MIDIQLSPHFMLSELLASPTATANGFTEQFEPTEQITSNLTALATNVLEPVRELIGMPLIVSSGYRCHRLNTHVGGEWNSQHLCEGGAAAADIESPGLTVEELYDKIKASSIPCDEVIIETNNKGAWWVHVSYDSNKGTQRGVCMKGVLQQSGGTICQADGYQAWVNS